MVGVYFMAQTTAAPEALPVLQVQIS